MIETLTEWLRASSAERERAVASSLARIRELDPSIHAWAHVEPQPATGNGPLSGIPFAAKDIFDTRGLPTEYGSPIYKGRIPAEDAAIVRTLRERGAILLGKTHTVQFAYGAAGIRLLARARAKHDLDAVERSAQDRAALRAANERIAKLEAERAQPQFRAVAPRTDAKQDLASPEYAKRWLSAVARGDSAELRDLSTSSSGAGIPTDMERRIIEKMYQANVLRQIAPVTTIDSKRTIVVENALPTSAWVLEAGSIVASDPSFSTAISVVPRKLVCATKMSQEFIEDAIGQGGIGSGLDWVASRIGLSMGLLMEQAYTVGDPAAAVPEPQGIALAAGPITQVTDLSGGTVTTISADNVIDKIGRAHV